MLNIYSNGSTWGGDGPLPLEDLYSRLETNTLDPVFEGYGNFITLEADHVHFFGNFFDYSHVFRLDTDDPWIAERLEKLIRSNQETPAYREAKLERAKNTEYWEHRREENRRAVRAARGLPA